MTAGTDGFKDQTDRMAGLLLIPCMLLEVIEGARVGSWSAGLVYVNDFEMYTTPVLGGGKRGALDGAFEPR